MTSIISLTVRALLIGTSLALGGFVVVAARRLRTEQAKAAPSPVRPQFGRPLSSHSKPRLDRHNHETIVDADLRYAMTVEFDRIAERLVGEAA